MDITILHAVMALLGLLSAMLIILVADALFTSTALRTPLALLAFAGIASTPFSRLLRPQASPLDLYWQCLLLAGALLIVLLLVGMLYRSRDRHKTHDKPSAHAAANAPSNLSDLGISHPDSSDEDSSDPLHDVPSVANLRIDADRRDGDAEDQARRVAALNDTLEALTEQLGQSASLPDVMTRAPATEHSLTHLPLSAAAANDGHDAQDSDALDWLQLPETATWLDDPRWNEDVDTLLEEPLLIRNADTAPRDSGMPRMDIMDIEDARLADDALEQRCATTETLPAALQAALRENLTAAADIESCLEQLEGMLATNDQLCRSALQDKDRVSLCQAELEAAHSQELAASDSLRVSTERLVDQQRRLLLKSRARLNQLQSALQEQQQDMARARRMARQAAELARRAATAQQETRSIALREQQARLRSQDSARRAMNIARHAISALAIRERGQQPRPSNA